MAGVKSFVIKSLGCVNQAKKVVNKVIFEKL
jgi:hypothetical protein